MAVVNPSCFIFASTYPLLLHSQREKKNVYHTIYFHSQKWMTFHAKLVLIVTSLLPPFIHSFLHHSPSPLQSQQTIVECNLNLLEEGPRDIYNIDLFAWATMVPMTMLINLGFQCLTEPMMTKLPTLGHLQSSSPAKKMERPEFGINSVSGSTI